MKSFVYTRLGFYEESKLLINSTFNTFNTLNVNEF